MLHKLRRIALCAWCLLPPRPAVATPTPGSSSGHHSQSPPPDHRILKDVTRAIGGTPLVDLSRIVERYGLEGRILAKLEYLSPGASKKDRIALSILEAAREEGLLQPGQPVVELTSGNTGTGLAIVCAVWGHPFVAVMSRGNSEERAAMMEALGATVVLVDQAEEAACTATTTNAAACNRSTKESSCCGYGRVTGADLDRVEQRAFELATSMGAFRVDQFVRGANREAHFSGTGPELWRDSGGILTDFVDFVGTGGSFGGIASFLKRESGGGVRCYVVEPEGAAVLRDTAAGVEREDGYESHRIQGGGYLKRGDNLPLIRGAEASPAKSGGGGGGDDCNRNSNSDGLLADGYLTVSDDEAISAARDLARYEGIFGGFSGGANLAAAVKLLRRRALERRNECMQHQNRPPGDDVVAILVCDSGLKYMSTDLWKRRPTGDATQKQSRMND